MTDKEEPKTERKEENKDESLESLTLRQNHEMIVMKPEGAHRVTLIGRKLYSALVAVTQRELAGKIPLATETFCAPLKSLLITSGGTGEERTVAKKYFQEMGDLKVTWSSTAPGDGVKWISLNMLSQAKIYVERGQTWLSWAFPPEIISMIANPERYAVWNLHITAKLGTYAALALYEICARYRDNPGGLTSRKPTDWWIDALSNTGPDADKKRREWRKFKIEKVTPAIKEINAETDLEIELIEHKTGRAVSDVQFSIRRKKVKQKEQNAGPIDTIIIEFAKNLGVSEPHTESLIRTYGEDLVRLKLHALQERIRDKSKSPIGNGFAYLKSILHAHSLELKALATQNKPASKAVLATQASNNLGDLAPSSLPDMLIEHEAEKIPLADIKEIPTISKIREEIQALSPEDRKFWLEEAAKILKAQGLFSAINQKRIDENVIAEGLLAGTVLDVYARAHYGDDWQVKNGK